MTDETPKRKRGRPPKSATTNGDQPKKIGRPKGTSPYAANMASIKNAIVEWISNGNTLREFCRQANMPNWCTVYDWMDEDAAFAQRFAHARDRGADAIAQQTIEIIDEAPEFDAHGRRDPGFIQWQKARVDTRLKLLAKWNPKKYGDKIEVSGGETAIKTVVEWQQPSDE